MKKVFLCFMFLNFYVHCPNSYYIDELNKEIDILINSINTQETNMKKLYDLLESHQILFRGISYGANHQFLEDFGFNNTKVIKNIQKFLGNKLNCLRYFSQGDQEEFFINKFYVVSVISMIEDTKDVNEGWIRKFEVSKILPFRRDEFYEDVKKNIEMIEKYSKKDKKEFYKIMLEDYEVENALTSLKFLKDYQVEKSDIFTLFSLIISDNIFFDSVMETNNEKLKTKVKEIKDFCSNDIILKRAFEVKFDSNDEVILMNTISFQKSDHKPNNFLKICAYIMRNSPELQKLYGHEKIDSNTYEFIGYSKRAFLKYFLLLQKNFDQDKLVFNPIDLNNPYGYPCNSQVHVSSKKKLIHSESSMELSKNSSVAEAVNKSSTISISEPSVLNCQKNFSKSSVSKFFYAISVNYRYKNVEIIIGDFFSFKQNKAYAGVTFVMDFKKVSLSAGAVIMNNSFKFVGFVEYDVITAQIFMNSDSYVFGVFIKLKSFKDNIKIKAGVGYFL